MKGVRAYHDYRRYKLFPHLFIYIEGSKEKELWQAGWNKAKEIYRTIKEAEEKYLNANRTS